VSGLLAPAGDAEILATHLKSLWQNPEQRSQLAENGCQRAVERFSLEQMHRQYVDVYEQVLGHATPTRFVADADNILSNANSH
jgi:glycosyltransferase involved in cell wall biosynthesis